ncbi:hypothetical protein [Lutimonas zeaxanthinifaciens]|uniref:hypothetical protein n=1 Tax=Lutimonas zeaxanthinifaciens TaxID=3060215 RepID=UPI00265D2A49|nr:hypothetical protein [Lutimonas sp. YSD2104]WKK64660.1 hypothetical protein QZH61_08670 [Lutimonas sp. YSD2104]
MNFTSIILSVLALILSALIVFYQYFFNNNTKRKLWVMAALRFVAILAAMLLLINPGVEKSIRKIEKPKLFLAIDNSASMNRPKVDEQLKKFSNNLYEDADLKNRFEVSTFLFGEGLTADSLWNFKEGQTNIHKAITDLEALNEEGNVSIVMVTDGRQNYGQNYAYLKGRNPIFPIVTGDTLEVIDLSIERINTNAYTTLDNNFPVEIFVNANLRSKQKSQLIVEKNGIEVFSKTIDFDGDKSNEVVTMLLPADSVGMQLYSARIEPVMQEKVLANNIRNFGVEVLDEQTNIAIVYGLLHPDVGMIKRSVESNRQRKASLLQVEEIEGRLGEFDLFVLYQPDAGFKDLLNYINEKNFNYMLFAGTQTNWRLLDEFQNEFRKESTDLVENLFPDYERDFTSFYTEDIGFGSFPPLRGEIGEITLGKNNQVLLTQRINDIQSENPLLIASDQVDQKSIVLFGEDIWKWRAESFSIHGSFAEFDNFFNSLIQYLQLSDRKKELELFYDPVYHAGQPILIQAKKYDNNLNLDLKSSLVLKLDDSDEVFPFYIKNRSYEVKIGSLSPGTYNFQVSSNDSEENREGSFFVDNYSLEEANISPNIQDLKRLADHSGGAVFYIDQFENVKTDLINNDKFRPLEKVQIKRVSLIDWRWLLGLIVLSLSLEWFLRKYRGLV